MGTCLTFGRAAALSGVVLGGRAMVQVWGSEEPHWPPFDPALSQGTLWHAGGTSHPDLLGIISKRQGKQKLFPVTLYF